jgi:hypothetical protein
MLQGAGHAHMHAYDPRAQGGLRLLQMLAVRLRDGARPFDPSRVLLDYGFLVQDHNPLPAGR